MFTEFLIGVLLSFFSIYGFAQTIINIFAYIGERKVFKNRVVYTVVTVKNEEDKVEGIVNSLLLKVLKDDNGAYINKVGIIDLDSTDKTLEILNILKRDKPYLNIYSKKEFISEIEK